MEAQKICYKCLHPIKDPEAELHGLHSACFREWFSLQDDVDFSDVVIKNASSSSPLPGKRSPDRFEKMNKSFFHGRYKKYSAELSGQSYILKVQDSRFPALPATEYLCNQIARSLKINIPEFYYIRFQGTTDTFVSRNFMSEHRSSTLSHIYIYLKGDEEFNCKSIIGIIERETGRIGEVEKFVELCLFDALIGNNDRHGRNVAFIITAKGTQLAPFYDNPSYLGVEEEAIIGARFEPKGKIFTTESNEPGMEDYVKEFMKLHHEKTVSGFLKKVDMQNIVGLIGKAFVSKARKKAIYNLIMRRYTELKDGISRQDKT